MLQGLPTAIDFCADERQTFCHFAAVQAPSPLALVQFGLHRTTPGYGFGPAQRDHFLLHFVHSGKGEVVIGRQRFEVHQGQMFFIPPGCVSYYEADNDVPWYYSWLGFTGTWGERALTAVGLDENHPVSEIPNADAVFQNLLRMKALAGRSDAYLALTGILYEVIFLLREASGQSPNEISIDNARRRVSADAHVDLIITIIRRNFNRDINVRHIADQMGFSRSYLTEMFKKKTGVSIKEYLIVQRMDYARLQMLRSNMNIQQIAYASGFHDPQFFSRLFKKRFGLSPREYRNGLKKETMINMQTNKSP